MAYRLVVRTEPAGRDWAGDLARELDESTETTWARDQAREEAEAGPSQGGVAEIILTAAVTAVADDAFEILVRQAHEVLDRLRKRRRNPPEVSVVVEEIPASEAEAIPVPAAEATPAPAIEATPAPDHPHPDQDA